MQFIISTEREIEFLSLLSHYLTAGGAEFQQITIDEDRAGGTVAIIVEDDYISKIPTEKLTRLQKFNNVKNFQK